MQMKFFDLLLMSITSLWKRKLRTVLTVLGVVIGITSIMVMISLGNGLKEATMENISSYSSFTEIEVNSNSYWDGSGKDTEQKYLDDALIEELLQIPHVKAVYPVFETSVIVKTGKYQAWMSLYGITKEHLESKNLEYAYGGVPTGEDSLELVYGNTILSDFYVEKTYEYPYYDKGELPDIDLKQDDIYVIFDTDAYYSYKNDPQIRKPKKFKATTAGIMAGGMEDWSQDSYRVYCDLDSLVANLKNVYKKKPIPGQPTRKNGKPYDQIFYSQLIVSVDEMENVSEISKMINDMGYNAYNDVDSIESQTKSMNMIEMVLGAIGAVSLLVAAIGITNTMMMSIYERTKEIGVMKVLGCNIHNIQAMFLLEAGFIGFIGGVIGVGFSAILCVVINRLLVSSGMGANMGISTICSIPFWLPGVSVVFAIIIGMVAGFLPSLRAMRLSPLAAIRNE